MDTTQFKQQAIADGYAEPIPISQPAHLSREPHAHDFDARLLVLDGEFTVGLEGNLTTYTAGEVCSVMAGTAHSEQTGPSGAKLLVARR